MTLLNLELSTNNRVRIITSSVCTFFFSGIVMSFNLWIPDRFFPMLPAFSFFAEVPNPIDLALLFVLMGSLLLTIFFRSKIPIALSILSTISLVVLDQMRLQPWVYIYFSVLLCLLFLYDDEPSLINCLRLICIGIYLWSGIHKINDNFLEVTFKSILEKIFSFNNRNVAQSILYFGYSIPVLEITCACLLFFHKSKKLGVVLATLIHFFILIFIIFIDSAKNDIVIPWNLAMIIIVLAAFYPTNSSHFNFQSIKSKISASIILLLFWIAPSLNFVSLWDSYLSFSFYSDKVNAYYIAIEESELPKVDKRFESFFVELPNLKGGKIIDIYEWSLAELNVPFYPEDRVFKQLSNSFCRLGIANEKLIFLKVSNYPRRGQYIPYKCQPWAYR